MADLIPERWLEPDVAPHDKASQYGLLRIVQAILTLLELSPANEAVRLAIWVAAGGVSHDPMLGALSYGVATLGVELAGAVTAAPLFQTTASQRFTAFLDSKLARVRKSDESVRLSWTTKMTATLFGGSVVAMALEYRERTGLGTTELRRYGVFTSLWLAAVCAVQGALMSEGVTIGLDHPLPASIAVGAAVALAIGRFIIKRHRSSKSGAALEVRP